MSGLIEAATRIMCASERRLDIVAQNVANISTPGFKRLINFQPAQTNTGLSDIDRALLVASMADPSQGRLVKTGNPLDLALSGSGFFELQGASGVTLTRAGQFTRQADGTVTNSAGERLQQAGGGDLVLGSGALSVQADGTVIEDGRAVARIAVVQRSTNDGTLEPADGTEVRQGMFEASNVALSDEMASMMQISRSAETGARLVRLYDDLLGNAISHLGGRAA